jgi:hypothetical protein
MILKHYRVKSIVSGSANDIVTTDETRAKGEHLHIERLLPTERNLDNLRVVEHSKHNSYCHARDKLFCVYGW